ncbi:MAG: hypothetical protein HFG44_02975 [Oscillospiraceae bacterium]|nr:hypothetical protein [Oscillospiraceae bacterium]
MQFEEIIGYCKNHNEAVFNEIMKAYDANALVPFVGAGYGEFLLQGKAAGQE